MKKQILFLAVFVLAVLAGINKSYGQYINYVEGATVGCTPAIPLTCISGADALHPLPGIVYTYSITTTPGTVKSIHWFVTDVSDVIAVQNALTGTIDAINGNYLLTATAAVYNKPDGSAPENTAASIDISWKSFDPVAKKVLLVAYVTGAAGCSDNIEVYRIEPKFGFTLDVAGILADGTATKTPSECVSPVESAIYDGTNLKMNYGENWVFFSVNAANFVDSWKPTITAAVTGGSTIGTLEWATAAEAVKNAAGVSTGTWHPISDPVPASAGPGGAVGKDGECIVVRVRVIHGSVENATADPVVTLTVDGVMSDPAQKGNANEYTNVAYNDLNEGNPNCDPNSHDTQDFTLTARPDITDTTPVVAPGFEPKN